MREVPKFLLYTADPDEIPGCWYPEDTSGHASLEEAQGGAEDWLKLGETTPIRIAVYQLVEVIRNERVKGWEG